MTSNRPAAIFDDLIRRALIEAPEWLNRRVTGRLMGYPAPDDCWIWTGCTTGGGYGYVRLPAPIGPANHAPVVVHRVIWSAIVGSIDRDLVLDHDGPTGCHNKACSNPSHLQAVSERHNIVVTGRSASAMNAVKTHCPKGHALAGENLVKSALARGGRNCRTCQRMGTAEQYRQLSAAARALGLTNRAYISTYGQSAATASAMIANLGIGAA